MKKHTKRLLAAGVLCSLLAGCNSGGGDKAQSGSTPGAGKGDKVIQVTRNIGGRAGFKKHFDGWKAAFEKKNPGWKMELVDLGNGDGAGYYKSRIATGDLPEIVQTWDLTRQLADGGILVPLDDAYYKKFGLPEIAKYKGKRYTTGVGLQLSGIAVNKNLMRQAGITSPPKDWDEWTKNLAKLKAKGIRPMAYGAREWSCSIPLSQAFAMNLFPKGQGESWTKKRDAGKVKFATDPDMKIIMKNMIGMVDNFVEKGAASDGYNDEQRDFYGGKAASWQMGCWIAGDIETQKVDFPIEYWPIPSMTGKPPTFQETSNFDTGWAMTTSATGEKKAKALSALEIFYDPAVYQLFLNGEAQFGVAKNVAAKKPLSSWKPAQYLFDNIAANAAKYGTNPAPYRGLDDMPPQNLNGAFTAVMQEIIAGNRDMDKLLGMLDRDWEDGRKAS